MAKKRYVQVGVGGRARMFYQALATTYRDTSEIVGLCDINQTRMNLTNRLLAEYGASRVPTYTPDKFDEMIKETKPDVVIVTSIDRTHHRYIIRAMELGCDVISEKPMTMDAEKCQAIIDAIARTGRKLRVTFNYRYAPHNTKLRELIMNDTIGKVTQVHLEWLLNTTHGSDYFRRWHRDKRNSGGLLVHKSTHHFDLVNFWLGSIPTRVFALGDLKFYGRENAEERGVTDFYFRSLGSEKAKNDPFALDIAGDASYLKLLYFDAENDDGYIRDQSVFGDGISIEDTMNVLVQYQNGAQLSYSMNAYSPYEGFRVCMTGTKGRIEMEVCEQVYVNAGGESDKEGLLKSSGITVFPMFGEPYPVQVPRGEGGHGGGDPVLLNDMFGTPEADPFNRAASHIDGALSILTGVAANRAIATGEPVNLRDLIILPGVKL